MHLAEFLSGQNKSLYGRDCKQKTDPSSPSCVFGVRQGLLGFLGILRADQDSCSLSPVVRMFMDIIVASGRKTR